MRNLIYWTAACLLLGTFAPVSAKEKEKEEKSPKKIELERLTLDNNLRKQRRANEIAPLEEERNNLRLRYEVQSEKRKADEFAKDAEYKRLSTEHSFYKLETQKNLREVMAEKEELSLRNMLEIEREKRDLRVLQAEQKKLDAEYRLEEAKHRKTLAETRRLLAETKLKIDLERAHLQDIELKNQAEKSAIDLEIKQLSLKSHRMKFEEEKRQSGIAKIRAEISLRSKKEEWKKEANNEPDYSAEPFQNGRLTISDRRITLNGPIYFGVADYITERIHFYNNESSVKPIFLVIDQSPGGSLVAGWRIVKAIEASQAPVKVVLKSFAASMAATIVTLADESYAYPNAVMLHHEMSALTWGNMTELKEQLENLKRYEARYMGPLAQKMGLSVKALRKKMYKKNSNGDWQEFADDARKLGWVTHVATEIRETGYIKRPKDEKKKKRSPFALAENIDDRGKRYVVLPRLLPFDVYYIHNPDNYYR